ncbi:MAG TPA: hypothetical protein PL051_04445 [Candidatus Saccharibacteria bacterium]|nr:hypothetical protein [Candidatus Saccharibacteria bacterium]
MDRKLKNTLTSRRTLLISSGAVFLVLLAYVVASFMYWQGYMANVAKHEAAKSAVETALDKPAKTTEQKLAKLAALSAATKQLFKDNTSCEPVWWAAWQTAFPAPASEVKRCKVLASKHYAVRAALDAITAYVRDEKRLIEILAPLAGLSSKLTENTWDASAKEWEEVASNAKSLQVGSEFSDVKGQATKQLDKVVTAWGKLATADKKENSADFTAAYDSLDRAITDLVSVANTSEDELGNLTKKLETAANHL